MTLTRSAKKALQKPITECDEKTGEEVDLGKKSGNTCVEGSDMDTKILALSLIHEVKTLKKELDEKISMIEEVKAENKLLATRIEALEVLEKNRQLLTISQCEKDHPSQEVEPGQANEAKEKSSKSSESGGLEKDNPGIKLRNKVNNVDEGQKDICDAPSIVNLMNDMQYREKKVTKREYLQIKRRSRNSLERSS